MEIKFVKARPLAKEPKHGSEYSAGYDLYSAVEGPVVINPHETFKMSTGLCMEIPEGYFGAIFPRSGLSTKQGLRPANCVGVVDSDYRGEIIVALHNDSNEPQRIEEGDRIAQLIVMPYLPLTFAEVESLETTDRGENGFGSTGQN